MLTVKKLTGFPTIPDSPDRPSCPGAPCGFEHITLQCRDGDDTSTLFKQTCIHSRNLLKKPQSLSYSYRGFTSVLEIREMKSFPNRCEQVCPQTQTKRNEVSTFIYLRHISAASAGRPVCSGTCLTGSPGFPGSPLAPGEVLSAPGCPCQKKDED